MIKYMKLKNQTYRINKSDTRIIRLIFMILDMFDEMILFLKL